MAELLSCPFFLSPALFFVCNVQIHQQFGQALDGLQKYDACKISFVTGLAGGRLPWIQVD